MPNRIIKETICTSDTLAELSLFEENMFYRLIVSCDDFGRLDARAAILKGRLFPLRDVGVEDISAALQRLEAVGLVDLYTVDGKPYLQIRTWEKHQTPRAKTSKYPGPDDADESRLDDAHTSACTCLHMHADANNGDQVHASDCTCLHMHPIFENDNENDNENENGGCRGEGGNPDGSPASPVRHNQKSRKVFQRPDLQQVTAYCKERGNNVDPAAFMDYYDSCGWKVGNKPMKDWQAAVRTWENRNRGSTGASSSRFDGVLT